MTFTRVPAATLVALLVACASQAPMPDLPGAPPRKPSGEIRKDPNADQALAQVEATAKGQPKPKQVARTRCTGPASSPSSWATT